MTMPTDTPSSSLDPPNFVRSNSSVQLSRSSSDLNDKMTNMHLSLPSKWSAWNVYLMLVIAQCFTTPSPMVKIWFDFSRCSCLIMVKNYVIMDTIYKENWQTQSRFLSVVIKYMYINSSSWIETNFIITPHLWPSSGWSDNNAVLPALDIAGILISRNLLCAT